MIFVRNSAHSKLEPIGFVSRRGVVRRPGSEIFKILLLIRFSIQKTHRGVSKINRVDIGSRKNCFYLLLDIVET